MNEQNNWINDFNNVFVKEGKLYGNHLELKDFISSLLSSQAQQMKEKMKSFVPEMRVIPDEKNSLSALAAHTHNICREQTLLAIESIEI